MKRKIISLLLCISLSVTMLVGCGTKEADSTSDKVDINSSIDNVEMDSLIQEEENIKVTKKLEKQYVESIEAYQEYYEQELDRCKYGPYVGITTNKEGLPMLWLVYVPDGESDIEEVTQLLAYEDGKVEVLAEIDDSVDNLVVHDGVVAAVDISLSGIFSPDVIYIYDSEKAIFRKIEIFEEFKKEIGGEELDLYQIECTYVEAGDRYIASRVDELKNLCTYYFSQNDEKMEMIYIGKVIRPKEITGVIDMRGYISSRDKIIFADGSIDDYQNFAQGGRYNGTSIIYKKCVVSVLKEKNGKKLFEVLKNAPAYSSEQLLFRYVQNGIEFDRDEPVSYTIKEFNREDMEKESLVCGYLMDGRFDSRFMEMDLLGQLYSEPYSTILQSSRKVQSWEDNIVTISVDGEEYKFQVEFGEDGEKISDITYISQ